MKKIFYIILFTLTGCFSITACTEDEEITPKKSTECYGRGSIDR